MANAGVASARRDLERPQRQRGSARLRARGAEPLRKFGGRRTEKTAYQATPIRQPRDRFKPVGLGQPQERQHSAAEGGTRDRLPPASGSIFCDRDGADGPVSVYDSPTAERVAQVRDGFVESWYGRGLLWSGATAKGVHLGIP